MIRFDATIAALALGITISLSSPAAAENVLRFTSANGGAVTMDPHSSGLIADRAATMQVYEQLLDIDSNLAIVPQLAVAWKPIDPNTWEFELRQGVRFHDGTPFTAEDVVFSIERARAGTSELQTPVANIAAIQAIDDRTLHITTTAPDPLLWMRLGFVAIMSKNWSETHDVATPAHRYGEGNYASRTRQRYRAIRARGVRAPRPLGPDPQSRLVGQRGQSDRDRPDRAHLDER